MILSVLALVIFVISYVFIITEWVNKMTAALLGGFLVIIAGIMTQDTAMSHVDWNVIFLLIGMMMVMSVLKETGVFQYLAIKTAKLAKGSPLKILIFMFVITGVVSALLDNVTTVMMLIPVVLLICSELKISPIPFIITMAISSNIGGTATMIGDPPNILIGSATDYNFIDFIINLAPVVVVIMLVSIGIIFLMYNKKLHVTNENRARLMAYKEDKLLSNKKLLHRSLVVVALMLIAFTMQGVLHLDSATIAMTAGLILLIMHNRKKVDKVLTHDIDWITIFFFIGLFMVVGSLKETGLMDMIGNKIVELTNNDIRTTSVVILWFSGIFSAIIDNVPFVATMIPMLKNVGTHIGVQNMHPVWWALALGSCLGGNGTLIGASANIISVGIANKNGFHISFREFTKMGVLFTIISLSISSVYLIVRYF